MKTLPLALAALFLLPAHPTAAQALSGGGRRILRGSQHPLALRARDEGRLPADQVISGASLVLGPTAAQQADLEQLLAAQQDPASPDYRRFLTPEAYAQRFGPSDADLAAATAWLRSQGLAVDGTSRSRSRIHFSGRVAAVEAAFGTELHRYLVNGETHFANATELQVPAALAGRVVGVRHLDDFRLKPHARASRLAAPRFTSSISGNHFLAPDDVATIYDLHPLYSAGFTGAGRKVAVVGQTAISLADVAAFRAASGLPANVPQTVLVPGSGSSVSVQADLDEAHLDVEWSGAVARDAQVVYVYTGSSNNYGVFDALVYAVDQDLAPVVSISYGDCEPHFSASDVQTLRQVLQQANAQGQTVVAASGDYGAADCEVGQVGAATTGLAVDLPASAPEVTGMGGTSFSADLANPSAYWSAANDALSGSALSYIPEAAWNDTAADGVLSAGGGGVSALFPKPSWQTGAGVPADGQRDVPDLALAASPDHDGYLACSQGSCVSGYRDASNGLTVIGGTSAGAPVFAGMLTLLEQASGAASLGNVNPTLYALAASAPAALHDVQSGSNAVPCTAGSTGCPSAAPLQLGYSAGSGYDLVTGVGTPDAWALAQAWPASQAATADFGLVASSSTVTVVRGQAAALDLTVVPEPLGGFTQAVSFSCSGLPAGARCDFSPGTVTPSGGPVHASVTIQTTGAATALRTGAGAGGATFLALLLPVGLLPGARRRRLGTRAWLGLALLATLLACGSGGGGGPGAVALETPLGSSTVTVTATSGGTPALTHAVQVTVVVQ